jgi:zinc protease
MRHARIGSGALGALLIAAALAPAAHAALDPKYDPARVQTPALHAIKPVKPERFTLPNGMVVYLLENHDLPVVTGVAYVRASSTWEPADKVGLAGVTGEVMRSGGTARHSGDWLDDRLAAIGASVSSAVGPDLASGGFRCLQENTAEVVGLWAEVLREPAFPDDKIELSKVGLRRAIAGRNDEMLPMLERVAIDAVYGKGSPWSREPEYATVEAITAEDCRRMHRLVFRPNQTILAIYGDFRSADMKKLVRTAFGTWARDDAPQPALPPQPERGANRVVFAPKEDVTQSGIVLVHLGFRADDPDYAAMEVVQTALGGGFQSRLFNRIRTERGLAYGTGASSGSSFSRPGVFLAYSLTQGESTMVALSLLREEVQRITEAPLTDAELRTAKESALNSFVFNFEDPSSVMFRAAYYELIGYPADFLQRYQAALENVTAQSALEAARRKILPGNLVVAIVGKESDFDRPLDSLGMPVERVDVTIPPPPSKVAVAEASPEALKEGGRWLARAAELAGGTAAWSAIRAVHLETSGSVTLQGQTLALTSTLDWRLPDRVRALQSLPIGNITQGFDGTVGWMSAMGQVREQPQARQRVLEEYERSFYHLFSKPGAIVIQALPEPRTIDGVAHLAAFVKSDVVKDWVILFAPDGRIARMEYLGEGFQGPAQQTEIFLDWGSRGTVQFPGAWKTLADGQPLLDSKVVSVTFNPELADSVFQKPAP